MKNNRIIIYLYAILAMLCWGSTFVWFKVVFKYYQPFTVTFFRLVIASILLSVFVLISKRNEKIDKADWKWFLLLSFFEPFCYFLGESFGLKFVSASLGSIIISTIPLVAPFFAFLFLKEQLTKFGFIGLLISFMGVVMIVIEESQGSNSIFGVLLMIFAVFSAVGYGLLLKNLSHKYSSVTIVKTQSILGMLYFLPFFLIFDFNGFLTIETNFEAIITIVKLAFFGSVLAFILMTTVVREIGLNNANIFTNLIPVFTCVLSYFLLKEAFSLHRILGIIIVISGLLISQISHLIQHRRVMDFINKFY